MKGRYVSRIFQKNDGKENIKGEISSEKLLERVVKIRKEDTTESEEFLKDLSKEEETFQETT